MWIELLNGQLVSSATIKGIGPSNDGDSSAPARVFLENGQAELSVKSFSEIKKTLLSGSTGRRVLMERESERD